MCKRHLLYLTAACVIFTFIYSPARLYFLSDDFDSLLFSLHPANILHSFRPFSDASLLADYSVWNMNATGFHFTNLVLHFACVFCFYFFARFIFLLRHDFAASSNLALAAGVLFLFYPFHSEALFWIVGRGAVLCTLFGLLCLIFYFKKDKRWLYFLLSLTCFAASLLSYEEAWIIPFIITLSTLLYQRKNRTQSLFYAAGFWLVFAVYLFGRYYFTQNVIGTPYGSERMINFDAFLLCKNVAALIFRSVIVPMQSSVFFSITCLIVSIILITLLVLIRKKINLVLYVSAICFLLSLIPVIPLGIDTHDTESERFLYFPSVFLLLFLTQFLDFVFTRKLWFTYVIVVAESIGLWQSYDSFVMSSTICRKTLSALSKTGKTDTIFCKQLPGQYKGAFIFRNGFESAVKLLKKDSAQSVTILSRSELYHPEKNYKIIFKSVVQHRPLSQPSDDDNLYIEWQEKEAVFSKQSF